MTDFTEILLKKYLDYKEQFNEEPINILKKIISTYGDIFYMWDDEPNHTIYVLYSCINGEEHALYHYLKIDYFIFRGCQTYNEILKKYLEIEDKEIKNLYVSPSELEEAIWEIQWRISTSSDKIEKFFFNCVMRLLFEYKVFYHC